MPIEPALHGCLLVVYVGPNRCLQATGLGCRGNDALAAVPGVAFGGDQSTCLQVPVSPYWAA